MGCKFGSFAFDLVVQPAYSTIKKEFPRCEVKAATDDVSTYHPDPAIQYAIFHRASELIFLHAGVKLNAGKSWLLLQPGAPTPPQPPNGLNITYEGIILVGAPIGIDSFVQTHTQPDKYTSKQIKHRNTNGTPNGTYSSNQIIPTWTWLRSASYITKCHWKRARNSRPQHGQIQECNPIKIKHVQDPKMLKDDSAERR